MQNYINSDHSIFLQLLSESQEAQRRALQNTHLHARPAFSSHYAISNVNHQFHFAFPSALGLTSIRPPPSYGMLQGVIPMNNQQGQSSLDRTKLFMLTAKEREITVRVMTERIAQQERLIVNNKRALEILGQRSSFAPSPAARTVQDRTLTETFAMIKSQPTATTAVKTNFCDSDSEKATKLKKKYHKDQQPKTKQDSKWLQSYSELEVYKLECGDCIVPRGFAFNPKLASWVAEQRKQYKLLHDGKNSSITPMRMVLLENIGFAWNAQEAAWQRHITDLKSFKKENGNCLVPLNHGKYPKLGLWVKEQRRHYALMKQTLPSHMTEERVAALNAISFCWDTYEAIWIKRFCDLCQYKAQFGDCIVPTNFSANPKLGTWVHHQRRQYKKYKEGRSCYITTERIRTLETIDFVWYPRKALRRSDEKPSTRDIESDSNDGDDAIHYRHRKRRRFVQS